MENNKAKASTIQIFFVSCLKATAMNVLLPLSIAVSFS